MTRKISWLNGLVISGSVLLSSAVLQAQATDVQAVEAEMMRKAAQNIEKHRKSDVLTRFTDAQGNPVKNAQVEIRQVSHEFPINWWGLSDRRIWLPGGGLITKEYEPKPVYDRLRKLLYDEWRTNLNSATDDKGTITFRGFHGKYAVMLRTGEGKSQSFEAVLRKDGPNQWEFTIDWR